MSVWQPIETAPKDGKEFLARTIERAPFAPAPTTRYDIARWKSGRTENTGRYASRTGNIVTHWMPLPKPPEDE